jgi:cell division protein FtsL
MSDAPSDPGTMLKLGFVVLCVGGCALGMLALRQAGLQAGHELAQTQLRIQKADEDLWKLRAEISTLAAPARIRELADKLGPLHGLTPKPGTDAGTSEISTASGPEIATVEQKPAPVKPKSAAKPEAKPEAKPDGKPATKVQPKQPAKPAGPATSPTTKPTATPPRSITPKPERGRAPGVA